MKSLFKYLKPYAFVAMLAPLCMIGEVTVDLLQPKLMSKIVDDGVLGNNMEIIVRTGLLMLLLVVIGGIAGLSAGALSGIAAQSFSRDLRCDVFSKIMDLSHEQTDKFTTGSLVTRLISDINQVQQFVNMSLRMFVRSSMLFLGGILMMLSLNIKFGIVLLISLPVQIVAMFILLKKANPIFGMVQKKLDRVNTVVQENISGARVVKAFSREEYEDGRFKEANNDLTQTNLRVQKLMALLGPMLMIIMNASVLAVIYIGGLQVEARIIGVGEVMAAVSYVTQILMSMMMVSNMFQMISRAKASAVRIVEVLETQPVITGGNKICNHIEEITFKNATFRYPGTEGAPVLKDINLEIKKGENIAILGATGSGKTTLINLISRFYDTTGGEVLINGINIKEYDLKSLRACIGSVLQTSELFSGTVADNIRWGDKNADYDKIRQACEIAQADEFISKMPDGYDGYIAEKGASLSGGQKQRLSIARTIAKQPGVLIFDDSTSALDLGTEARLQMALKENLADTTVIMIAQRVASVINCDRIAVLNNGVLDAVGTHDELMDSSAVYRDIYDSQMRKGDESNGK